ncbi:hypothetical protein GOBAR_AA31430 [Gossypium barbadense]|uniref:Uncharacterized protein n=1 Tax=Gossypium barbadense TaxID=3634 RepID=A0A2P5WDU4_GOSBA|nr:hypothetical protein GOBAR_AA31430 [Gossypium barbadense]
MPRRAWNPPPWNVAMKEAVGQSITQRPEGHPVEMMEEAPGGSTSGLLESSQNRGQKWVYTTFLSGRSGVISAMN